MSTIDNKEYNEFINCHWLIVLDKLGCIYNDGFHDLGFKEQRVILFILYYSD